MSLPFGQSPHLVHKRQRLHKIREFVRAGDVMPVHDRPSRHLLRQRVKLLARQRRHSSAAWNAVLAGKLAHEIAPPRIIPPPQLYRNARSGDSRPAARPTKIARILLSSSAHERRTNPPLRMENARRALGIERTR